MRPLFPVLLLLLLQGCCTKKDCSSDYPELLIDIKCDKKVELNIQRIFRGTHLDKMKYNITGDTTIALPISSHNTEQRTIIIYSNDNNINDTINSIQTEITRYESIVCNKCFGIDKEEELDIYEILSYNLNQKLTTGNTYVITF